MMVGERMGRCARAWDGVEGWEVVVGEECMRIHGGTVSVHPPPASTMLIKSFRLSSAWRVTCMWRGKVRVGIKEQLQLLNVEVRAMVRGLKR